MASERAVVRKSLEEIEFLLYAWGDWLRSLEDAAAPISSVYDNLPVNENTWSNSQVEVEVIQKSDWLLRDVSIRKALSGLPIKARSLIILRYVHLWPWRKVAEQLEISMPGIFRARRIALETLADLLT